MESLGTSPGALPSGGLVFQLICCFHRYWAYSSKSTVWPKMEPVLSVSSFSRANWVEEDYHFKAKGKCCEDKLEKSQSKVPKRDIRVQVPYETM